MAHDRLLVRTFGNVNRPVLGETLEPSLGRLTGVQDHDDLGEIGVRKLGLNVGRELNSLLFGLLLLLLLLFRILALLLFLGLDNVPFSGSTLEILERRRYSGKGFGFCGAHWFSGHGIPPEKLAIGARTE